MSQSITEDDINRLHKEEIRDIADNEFDGNLFLVPIERIMEVGAKTRERWCQFVAERDGLVADPSRRHDKSAKLTAAVRANVGKVVNVALLQEMGECSRSTAYDFINDNRSMFRKVANGSFEIIDVNAARAADKRTTTGDVQAALSALTGQTVARGEPGKL